MPKPTVTTINVESGEQTVREHTDDEMAEFENMPPTVENVLSSQVAS